MSPRIKSNIWVDALLRRLMSQGNFGAVIHKGTEAGAIFVAINRLNQTYDLLVPALGASQREDAEFLFEKHNTTPQAWADLSEYIARQRKFDSDLWVVEIELRIGYADLKCSNISVNL